VLVVEHAAHLSFVRHRFDLAFIVVDERSIVRAART
jgi:hypothetical protein